MLKIVLLFLLTLIQIINAEECSTIDLNESKSSPFNKIPIYDQDGVGLCYSYAAVQMVDYYRLLKGQKNVELTNPLYAAWLSVFKDPKILKNLDLKGGGYVEDVVSALKKHGACSDKDTKKALLSLMKASGKSEAEILNFLQLMFKGQFSLIDEKSKQRLFNRLENEMGLNCSQFNATVDLLKIKKILGLYPSYILEGFLKDCRTSEINVPNLVKYNIGSDEKFKKIIDQSFERKLPPQVSINCSEEFFSTPAKDNGRNILGLRISQSCGMHAVVLAGRKKINNECSYMIRNSYGAFWYPKGASSCACKLKNGNYKSHCQKGEGMEYLGCWFKSTDLMKSLGDISVFE